MVTRPGSIGSTGSVWRVSVFRRRRVTGSVRWARDREDRCYRVASGPPPGRPWRARGHARGRPYTPGMSAWVSPETQPARFAPRRLRSPWIWLALVLGLALVGAIVALGVPAAGPAQGAGT